MKKDFTLTAYAQYLTAIKSNFNYFLKFEDYIPNQLKHKSFCLIRHDVDRKPENALEMAKLEHKMGISATYYFRAKRNTFKPEIFKEIIALGHEVGYHYESLSDTNGNIALAVKDFEKHLERFRKYIGIKTISMHGRPLKPHDNRDIWKLKSNHNYLTEKLKILGEVYLDIDYTDIIYINDTGRNWLSTQSNLRDKTNSNVPADFHSAKELLNYLKHKPHPKMVFQIHPERWTDNAFGWHQQNLQDKGINAIKSILKRLRKK